MRSGRYAAAWKISDAVLQTGPRADLPRHLQTFWRGQSLAGARVVILCHRGLGDTLQFIRYASKVRSLARHLTVVAPAQLLPLLRTISSIDLLLALDRDEDRLPCDLEIEVTELPHVFRTTLATVPSHVPYFRVSPVPLPDAPGLAVGIVWTAGDWDVRRSVPAGALEPLRALPGVTLYSFQRGAAAADARRIGARPLAWSDIIHEAGMLRSLDLLISVDTMPAHLAGALATPVWLLLHSAPDWRWLTDRDDSPWYPTMRLFRQERPAHWGPVIRRVAAELRGLCRRKTV